MKAWPSRDPIGERGGVNLYGMVRNNALSFVDLLGLNVPSVSEPGDGFISIPRSAYDSHNELSRDEEAQLDRGCVGLTCAAQGKNPRTGKYMPEPEHYPGTKCYMTEAEASEECKKCKNGKQGTVFAKQGDRKGRGKYQGPLPRVAADGTIPNDSIIPLKGGFYNYITKFPDGTYGGMNHQVDPRKPQRMWSDDVPLPTSDDPDGYPAEMWCCSPNDK